MSAAADFDARAFRHALGKFATGVTIITTLDSDGAPVGLTASSFNSVSLEPPLVLWSLDKTSLCLPAFSEASHWAVHVLSAEQQALSDLFAQRHGDKFDALDVQRGEAGIPLLGDYAARFQCRAAFQYEGGDHVIFVGEVIDIDSTARQPLVFQAGRYAIAASKSEEVSLLGAGNGPHGPDGFTEDSLGYLIARAHFQQWRLVHGRIAEFGLDDEDYFILSILAAGKGRTLGEVLAALEFTGLDVSAARIEALEKNRLLEWRETDGRRKLFLTDEGNDRVVHAMAASKAVEEDAFGDFESGEAQLLRNLLKRLILATTPGKENG